MRNLGAPQYQNSNQSRAARPGITVNGTLIIEVIEVEIAMRRLTCFFIFVSDPEISEARLQYVRR